MHSAIHFQALIKWRILVRKTFCAWLFGPEMSKKIGFFAPKMPGKFDDLFAVRSSRWGEGAGRAAKGEDLFTPSLWKWMHPAWVAHVINGCKQFVWDHADFNLAEIKEEGLGSLIDIGRLYALYSPSPCKNVCILRIDSSMRMNVNKIIISNNEQHRCTNIGFFVLTKISVRAHALSREKPSRFGPDHMLHTYYL